MEGMKWQHSRYCDAAQMAGSMNSRLETAISRAPLKTEKEAGLPAHFDCRSLPRAASEED